MKKRGILFFADRLPPLSGGMEMHGGYFIDYFKDHLQFPLLDVVSKDKDGRDTLVFKETGEAINYHHFNPEIVFFNSGRWIEELEEIRNQFPNALFLYRTGGNEILKAPLVKNHILDHFLRQRYWVKVLNQSIDVLITNSVYTESRLRDLGITCSFFRSVGGVNSEALKSGKKKVSSPLRIFSAARFVPYKNHKLFLRIIKELVKLGFSLNVRLAGDGPLLDEVKAFAQEINLLGSVTFLGVLNNQKTCQEIANADVYMQLSGDVLTSVPGGRYIHSEGMGRSIIEALTAGTFVIAGNSGALPEIVKGDKGILVDLFPEEQIVKVIAQTLQNLPSKGKFDPTYCWSHIFAQYKDLFRRESASCN